MIKPSVIGKRNLQNTIKISKSKGVVFKGLLLLEEIRYVP